MGMVQLKMHCTAQILVVLKALLIIFGAICYMKNTFIPASTMTPLHLSTLCSDTSAAFESTSDLKSQINTFSVCFSPKSFSVILTDLIFVSSSPELFFRNTQSEKTNKQKKNPGLHLMSGNKKATHWLLAVKGV